VRLPSGASAATGRRRAERRSTAAPRRWLDGRTVVVVDDQADARELLAVVLEHCGAEVRQCASAADALECCRTMPVDLLVSDIAMPNVDGYQLIREVRRLHPDLPAVAVSAYARPEDRQTARMAGYNGYCAKPVEASELLRVVEAVLAS
jgi:CheY-like chemotaxis protein